MPISLVAFSGLKIFCCLAQPPILEITPSQCVASCIKTRKLPCCLVWTKVVLPGQISHNQHLGPFPDLAPLPCIFCPPMGRKTYKYSCVDFLLVGQTRPCRPQHSLSSQITGRIWSYFQGSGICLAMVKTLFHAG